MMQQADKLLFPDDGIDKAGVARYFADIAGTMAPHVLDRFLTVRRFPDGIGEEGFFQQHRADHYPDSMPSRRAPTADGSKQITHIVLADTADLEFLADQGTVELHGWLSRTTRPDRPDRVLFDLDPGSRDLASLIDCANALRSEVEKRGLDAFVMSSGSRGLHIAAPLDGSVDFDRARALAREVAETVVDGAPDRFTIEQRKRARGKRLYIDTTRNAYGQTSIIPYSLRALPGAPVATPLDWDELQRDDFGPQRYRLDNVLRRLGQKTDPWRDFEAHAAKPD